MLVAFYILVLQQILQGMYSLWEGFRWFLMVRRRVSTHSGLYVPSVALICSCKGAEPELEENLRAFTRFEYPNYEIYLALATSLDPAVQVIERIKATSKHPVHIVIAGPPQKCSEKVHNLRRAVETAGEKFEAFVFVDSDVRLGRTWLARLVAPLGDASIGAATTYRWMIPAVPKREGLFWSALAAAWNAAVATLLGRSRGNFCWGGGVAIRRANFEKAEVMEHWEGALSDDWAMTRALDEAGMEILFVPECFAPTLYGCTRTELLEFTNRQMLIARVYAPRMWMKAVFVHLVYCTTLLFSAVTILGEMVSGNPWGQLLLLVLVIPLLAAAKGALRGAAAADALPDWRAKLDEWGWVWIALAPLVSFLFVWNAAASLATRRLHWRGIWYELLAPNDTRILMR